MPSKRRLRIPEPYQPGLSKLLRLLASQAESLLNVLSASSPVSSENEIVSQIVELTHLPDDDVKDIVRAVIGLYSARLSLDVTAEEFAEDICFTMQQSVGEERKQETDWNGFTLRLQAIFGLDKSLGVRSKVYDLISQNEHLYHSARILTDIRPVFDSDASTRPIAAAILHTLKIVYYEGGETKEIFVSLDGKDIHDLREALNRADQKALSLKQLLDADRIPYLNVEIE